MIPTPLAKTLAQARGFLFDMDGVLIDSEPLHARSIVELSGELGPPLASQDALAFKGASEKWLARHLMDLYPRQPLSAAEIISRKNQLYDRLLGEVTLFDGVIGFLMSSRASNRLHGLTTSASRATQQHAFATFRLAPFFDETVTGDDVVRGKPDPEPYLLTAARLGLETSDCVVFEDSLHGVRSAKSAGCTVVALTTSFAADALRDAGADFRIDSFRALG